MLAGPDSGGPRAAGQGAHGVRPRRDRAEEDRVGPRRSDRRATPGHSRAPAVGQGHHRHRGPVRSEERGHGWCTLPSTRTLTLSRPPRSLSRTRPGWLQQPNWLQVCVYAFGRVGPLFEEGGESVAR